MGNAYAQTEQWDTYMAKFGDKPGSVLVDMGLIARAPDKRYQYLVITGPQAMNCDKQGLPNKDEIGELEEILSAADNFITGVTAKVLTGTLTYKCERLNYYYVKDTIGVRNALMRMYNRSYANYNYAINIMFDPGWRTYLTFLFPDEPTRDWMENSKVIAQMAEQGDSLKTQRDINFDFFFNSDSDRHTFAGVARSKGYKADKLIASKSTIAPFEIIVSKYGLVKIDLIQAMADELKKAAKLHRGIYNGWDAKK
jgi:hypothetical protein